MSVFGGNEGGVSLPQVLAIMPQPATTAPPAVAALSDKGTTTPYARSDHTHQSSVQANILTGTPNASGEIAWTFPQSYGTGVVPVINALVEQPSGQTYKLDVVLKASSITNTGCIFVVNKTNINVVATILGGVIAVIVPQTASVTLHAWARKPTA